MSKSLLEIYSWLDWWLLVVWRLVNTIRDDIAKTHPFIIRGVLNKDELHPQRRDTAISHFSRDLTTEDKAHFQNYLIFSTFELSPCDV